MGIMEQKPFKGGKEGRTSKFFGIWKKGDLEPFFFQ